MKNLLTIYMGDNWQQQAFYATLNPARKIQ